MTNKLWEAEFRGFFWGEGYIGIYACNRHEGGKHYKIVRPQLSINQAENNLSILKEIQSKLGGRIQKIPSFKYKDGILRRTQYLWIVNDIYTIQRVIDILKKGLFPDKKLDYLSLVEECISIMKKHKRGTHYDKATKSRMLQLVEQVKKIKSFTVKSE